MSAIRSFILPIAWALESLQRAGQRGRHRSRLTALLATQQGDALVDTGTDLDLDGKSLKEKLTDRLGKAGYICSQDRKYVRSRAYQGIALAIILSGALGAFYGIAPAILAATASAYLGVLCVLGFLRWRSQQHEQELLFFLPITLESIILLVEAGLGVFPAVERLVSQPREGPVKNPVLGYFKIVHQLSVQGIPFQQALEQVADSVNLLPLAHTLLHLDVSATEGGELVPSLRSLSEHAHTEWRLSVETRVRRLENLVVFPVFASVIGLMLLAAAVPLVPVLEFASTLESRGDHTSVRQSRTTTLGVAK